MKELASALARREPLHREAEAGRTTAYRLFSGEGEGIPGLVVDRYAEVAVVQQHEGRGVMSETMLRAVATQLMDLLPLRSVYLKRFVPDRSATRADEALHSPIPFAGEPAAEEIPIRENGAGYLIRPYDGFSTGLFLDQRENRRFLAEDAARSQVLNLFAYTCAFSVACALRGGSTTSVDVSRRYLEWGKRNFETNSLPVASHRFFVNDAFVFLKGARKRGEEYDLVIVDPPSFSRNREGKVFSVRKDFPRLIADAAAVVARGGRLFLSSNFEEWTSAHLAHLAEEVLGDAFETKKPPELPLDFRWQSQSLSYCLLKR